MSIPVWDVKWWRGHVISYLITESARGNDDDDDNNKTTTRKTV